MSVAPEKSERDPFEQLADSFLARYRAGERPSVQEYADRYPELAEQIRALFPALVLMEEHRPGKEANVLPKVLDVSKIPKQLGEYRILREVGRGGMGVVYEAVQETLGRHVALKVLPFNPLANPTHLERFRREARAAARLHHTHIVPVFGVGECEGIHFFAMQFIHGQGLDDVLGEVRRLRRQQDPTLPGRGKPGESLAFSVAESLLTGRFSSVSSWVENGESQKNEDRGSKIEHTESKTGNHKTASSSHPSATGKSAASTPSPSESHSDLTSQTESKYFRSVAQIGLQVADALAYAHSQGVLHRDIKPSNLLLDLAGQVWITDFGLAKTEESDELTHTGDMVGTLRYMAPERLQGKADPRSDVYGLGITLYEMLTLRPAFADSARHEVIKKVVEEDPPSPHKLDRKIPRDLETIVLKAIAKEPQKRYATAESMAEDLRRFLADRPIEARRSSTIEQVWRWCRRNKAVASLAAAVAALLLAVATVAFFDDARIRRELHDKVLAEAETTKANQEAKRRLFTSLVAEARANRLSRRSGRRVHSLEILEEATRLARELQLPEDDFVELRNETIACLPLVDLRVAKTWEGHPTGTLHLGFDGNLERYVRYDHLKNVASVRRVSDDSEVCQIPEFAPSKLPWLVALSPDGQFLARTDIPNCKVWKVTSEGAQPFPEQPGSWFRFSPDSRHLAIATQDGTISIYELPSYKRLRQWQTGPLAITWGHTNLAFHPEKPQLAVRNSGKITIFDLDSGNKLAEYPHSKGHDALEWLPDGKRLASADVDRSIYVLDASTGNQLDRLAGHTNDSNWMAVHPAGELLASTCWDRTLRLWDLATGQELFKTSWDISDRHSLRFSRDGRWLAADMVDHQLRLWELIPACGYQSLARQPHGGKEEHHGCAVSAKHSLLALGMDYGVGLWELPSGRALAFLPVRGGARVMAFDASGALLTFGFSGQMRWPIEVVGSGGRLRIGAPQPLPFPASAHQIATNRDGRVMASAQGWGALVSHADHRDQLIRLEKQHDVRFIAVSPYGEWIATGSHSATDVYVKIWEAGNGRPIADLPVDSSSLVGFSPNGRWLLTTGGGYRLWEVGTWREGPKIEGTSTAFAFSPEGNVLAVEAGAGTVRLLDPDTGREYAQLEDPNQDRAAYLTFSADGSQLLACAQDSLAVHAWDLRALGVELAKRGLDWDLPLRPLSDELRNAPPLQVTVVSKEQALAHVKLGQWEEAANDYAALMELDPDDHWYWFVSAPLYLQTGKVKEYQRICREMLTRFGNTDNPEVAERTAKTCLLIPDAVVDLQPVFKLADQALAGKEKHPNYGWFVLNKGLAEYRAGHYAAALDWLSRLSPNVDGVQFDALVFAVRAMAKHRLSVAGAEPSKARLAEEARTALADAETILSQKMPDPKAGRPFGDHAPFHVERFNDWLHARILTNEAKMLLGPEKKTNHKDTKAPKQER